jgi:hypothetical protein
MTNQINRGRRTLLLIVLVFFGPLFLAMVLYMMDSGWRPTSTTEYGQLQSNPLQLPDTELERTESGLTPAKLHGKWTLIQVDTASCEETCQEALVHTRQIRLTMGNKMTRLQRLFVVTSGDIDQTTLQQEHPDLLLLTKQSATELSTLIGNPTSGELLLADPLGNVILLYPPDATMKGIRQDLKHLFELSRIG